MNGKCYIDIAVILEAVRQSWRTEQNWICIWNAGGHDAGRSVSVK